MKQSLLIVLCIFNVVHASNKKFLSLIDFKRSFRFDDRKNPNIRTLNALLYEQGKELNQIWRDLPQCKSQRELNRQLKPIFNSMFIEIKSRAEGNLNDFYLRQVNIRFLFYDTHKLLLQGIDQKFLVETIKRLFTQDDM